MLGQSTCPKKRVFFSHAFLVNLLYSIITLMWNYLRTSIYSTTRGRSKKGATCSKPRNSQALLETHARIKLMSPLKWVCLMIGTGLSLSKYGKVH